MKCGQAHWKKKKIDTALETWERSNPTMQGRHLIVHMVVGAMTQYLTTVQGMPKMIEKQLVKRIRKFMWGDKSQSPVNFETLLLPVTQGGQDVLDIEACNQAIQVMEIKTYLNLSGNRPTWTWFTDDLMARAALVKDRGIDKLIRINPFLQSWKPNLTTKPNEGIPLPRQIRDMWKTAETFGVRPEGLAFMRDIIWSCPMWLHADADRRIRRLNHSQASQCLQQVHEAISVGDMQDIVEYLDEPNHRWTNNCMCFMCDAFRQNVGCEKPHRCMLKARELIDTLLPKWNPLHLQPEDFEDAEMSDTGENIVKFDKRITMAGPLANIFRVFMSGKVCNNVLDKTEHNEVMQTICTATDGSCLDNGSESAAAGAGLTINSYEELDMAVQVPPNLRQTNQVREMLTTLVLAKKAPQNKNVLDETDSKYVMSVLTKVRQRIEDEGYIGTQHAELIQETIATLWKRKTETSF